MAIDNRLTKPLTLAVAASLVACSGLSWPRAALAAPAVSASPQEAARTHWAFQKVTRPNVPTGRQANWCRTPIDLFILAEWERRGIEPGPAADRRTLIRRASLDLTGLPPTPEEVEAFVADPSPEAFAAVVDRLLDSPRYGERWARHWLDLARYAESEGFKADETRPNAWRYRDYVIRSLNDDKPYDRFVREQIAGDELWPDDPEARIATAFNRHYADESNARNLMQRRQEILNDITDTVGAVFMGLTYACARCHDHKFDPISQLDYYRLQAFFANTAARDDLALLPPQELARYRERLAAWEDKTRAIREEMATLEAPQRRAIEKDYFDKYPEEIRAIFDKPEEQRTPFERQMAWKAHQYLDPSSHEYIADSATVAAKLKGAQKQRWQELKRQLDEFSDQYPGQLPVGSAMVDLGSEAPRTFLLNRGAFDKPKEEVAPGLLQILYPTAPALPARAPGPVQSTGRRTVLANLLVDPQSPFSARVMVNRVWQHHFGQGIVSTPSDFGLKGQRPTHPQLLDWLSSEFVAGGWRLKSLHRLILNSAVYQLASTQRDAPARLDPANRLWWRFPRERLQGEVIRDAALAVSGLLNPKMGGPSIFPELPTGMPAPRGGWKVNEDPNERNRRSVYVFVRRNTRYPMFDAFDMPDPHESCGRRNVTTSPLQALTLLNSQLTLEWAQALAERVLRLAGADPQRQITAAFQLAFGRPPDAAEARLGREFLRDHRQLLEDRARYGDRLALPTARPNQPEPSATSGSDAAQGATLVDFCHTLLNANEFVYRN
jgi:hypothetical protein